VGIALATAGSAWMNAGLLAVVLHRRDQLRLDVRLRGRVPRILLAALCMVGALWGGAFLLAPYFYGGLEEKVPALAALVAAGLVTYGIVAQLVGAARLSDVKAAMRRR
jgi:putative peptidoglycan lipid II flippase